MNRLHRLIRLLAALPVLLTLALPAEQAADEPPPPTGTPCVAAPVAGVPAAPNYAPGAPPGCGTIHAFVASPWSNLPIPDAGPYNVMTKTIPLSELFAPVRAVKVSTVITSPSPGA